MEDKNRQKQFKEMNMKVLEDHLCVCWSSHWNVKWRSAKSWIYPERGGMMAGLRYGISEWGIMCVIIRWQESQSWGYLQNIEGACSTSGKEQIPFLHLQSWWYEGTTRKNHTSWAHSRGNSVLRESRFLLEQGCERKIWGSGWDFFQW